MKNLKFKTRQKQTKDNPRTTPEKAVKPRIPKVQKTKFASPEAKTDVVKYAVAPARVVVVQTMTH